MKLAEYEEIVILAQELTKEPPYRVVLSSEVGRDWQKKIIFTVVDRLGMSSGNTALHTATTVSSLSAGCALPSGR